MQYFFRIFWKELLNATRGKFEIIFENINKLKILDLANYAKDASIIVGIIFFILLIFDIILSFILFLIQITIYYGIMIIYSLLLWLFSTIL